MARKIHYFLKSPIGTHSDAAAPSCNLNHNDRDMTESSALPRSCLSLLQTFTPFIRWWEILLFPQGGPTCPSFAHWCSHPFSSVPQPVSSPPLSHLAASLRTAAGFPSVRLSLSSAQKQDLERGLSKGNEGRLVWPGIWLTLKGEGALIAWKIP